MQAIYVEWMSLKAECELKYIIVTLAKQQTLAVLTCCILMVQVIGIWIAEPSQSQKDCL